MKKLLLILMLGLILSACSNEESTNSTATNVTQESVEEKVTTDEKETVDLEDEEVISAEENTDNSIPLTQEEFNQKYELDNEMDQYPNGKFELKDGTVINADDFSYLGGETFDYATAIFFDGQIAHLQLELKDGFSKEAVLNELEFNEGDVEYMPGKINNNIVEIVVDETFADENIKRFPSEWD